ncbi:MAG TPA: VIT and VWA domain-containing protein [Bryobacteraceae bacterium]|nr:VIT and VWA domain-containing protein [Bryobacteraceae bacterium]HOQ46456.1 VIT and VWA domain-containing protein [Bryobacteraceae bacterium]HPU72615.1 VIT and VWA domain-containing protein [Bryobacteraceae bacterium]
MISLPRLAACALVAGAVVLGLRPGAGSAASGVVTQGSLFSLDSEGQIQAACPLKHTDVKAEITGFLARVTVTQEFSNPFPEKIEAVYTFPLPPNSAVDDMTMLVGGRTVRGKIKRREEARAIYEAARASGRLAGLLDQQRPNIFTQSVANIMPGEQVRIEISYVETLKYEDGRYEFSFPMVVGPRYIPGRPAGRQGGGWSPDTDRVPDASRITPPVARPGTRAGHDISLEVALDAGVVIDAIESPSHEIDVERRSPEAAVVRLKNKAVLPNKDFVLKYDVAGSAIRDAVLAHRTARGGYFTLILQPPERISAEDITPKELVFVIDTSGSMSGFPIEKAKETMKLALDGLNPRDTFNLITFSGDTRILFPEPVPATRENLAAAQRFLARAEGSGGTEMMKAIRAALEPSDAQDHIRVVCFMTDGYVGNDMEIIAEVQKHPNARIFAFGIGSSVNRFLLDEMAKYGRGEVEYVGLNDDGSAAARRFHERVRNPLLTDIEIDWGNLAVSDVYPRRIPDLFSAKPLIIHGRYSAPGSGTVRLRGRMAGREFSRAVRVTLPDSEPRHDVLAPLWARARISDLMGQDYFGLQSGTIRTDIRDAITQLGLDYRLMTQFTSFVAVEEMTITDGGQPRRVEVPVEMPEGVSYEGVFGRERDAVPANTFGAAKQVAALGAPARLMLGGAAESAWVGAPVVQSPPKVHPAIAAVIQRPEANAPFVRNGKAEIQVWLTDTSPAAIAKLKQLGFEILLEPKSGKMIVGRLPVAQLKALSELSFVRYISPQV